MTIENLLEDRTDTYTSDWIAVTQERVNQFADVTLDHQWIHVDPEAAAQTPFGGTIAHGFLTLSLLSNMAATALPVWDHPDAEVVFSMNYGFDKVRFVSPVPVGKRVRGVFVGPKSRMKAPDQVQITYAVTVEIEGEERPAVAAEWLFLVVVKPKTP